MNPRQERIIKTLLASPTNSLPGDEIYMMFGINSKKLQKDIKQLRHAGYPIETIWAFNRIVRIKFKKIAS